MGYGGNNMGYGGNSMNYGGGSSMNYGGGNSMSYGGGNSYPPSYTSSSPPSYSSPPPTYGSGSNNWGGNSNPYNDCVQQCQAQYPSSMSPNDGSPSDSNPSKTHVVYVAPTQGVLRYVPFAINASVGDTVKFIWGANNHTVTKGSELTPCNVTSDSPFASGLQLKDFVFEQVVNDTNPTFFYCAVPTHCTKGMFGIINPPNALGSPTSVGSMMQSLVAASPDLAKMRTYTDNATMNSSGASSWGTSIDMSSIPQWAQQSFVENVFYTRLFLAANPDAFQNGSIDASLGGNPPVIPQDITQVTLNNSTNSPNSGYGSNPASPSSMTTTSTVVPTPTSAGSNTSSNLSGNGASSVARSGLTVVFALAAGFFLL
jgi:plastocyanin